MASILEDWNGVSSGGISSGTYGLGGDMNISAGEGMDGASFPLSQVLHVHCVLFTRYL